MIAAGLRLAGVRVLLVDHEEPVRDTLAIVLRTAGACVATAAMPRNALKAMQAELPDVVVFNRAMPSASGDDLVHHLRALTPTGGDRAMAIALSSDAAPGTICRTLGAVFDAEMGKPLDTEKLTGLIAALVRARAFTRAATFDDAT